MDFQTLTHILDQLKVGIVIANKEGTVLWGNHYYSELAKYDIQKYIGRDIREISKEEDVVLHNDRTLIDTIGESNREITEIVKYSTNDYVITTAAPVSTMGTGTEYILYTITNYSETMRMERELSNIAAKVDAIEIQLQQEQLEGMLQKEIIVESPEMKRIYQMAARLAPSDVSVMLLGESGVGKDVLAKFIHRISPRSQSKFIHVNLGAIPESLFESQLFGYEPGAFTGASKNGKIGLIQLADGGTLFLDEVGELPLEIQVKLLQVVQDKEVRRIGGIESIPVDIRIISATNRHLPQMVEAGSFRLDLYYRLNVVEVKIPPLRERREEIVKLSTLFLEEFNAEYNKKRVITNDVFTVFSQYPWPGNIRELRHVIESLVVISRSEVIDLEDLPGEMQAEKDQMKKRQESITPIGGPVGSLKEMVASLEKRMIKRALDQQETALSAAKSLGIDASTLSKKRKRYGI
ncbi:sigma-54 interaction domain-containing protein [Eubacterium barkeri]|uniref:HTH-type transcriptional regulatory protein TyrR n=1 Tax=Eubacterium barkeri TaxID=1528 RepID=A0A1H3JCI9_EUBBA|nr:sigma 54-interacting transcriptional regulator [Eubacterium barkeri]SDY37128.1 Transcriptional regulator containing PAS, AAA-type ATPase, and DNA-binding Fis domains [Eubacterium barkeri]